MKVKRQVTKFKFSLLHIPKGGNEMVIVVITPCSKSKDDSVPIPSDSRVVDPSYYLYDKDLISELHGRRRVVFSDSRAKVGRRETYAFDLYVRAGRAYRDLFMENYHRLKQKLLEGSNVEWFFLSGGYGIIHALERSRKYQATFSQNIAYQENIPYTAKLWSYILPKICDAIFLRFEPKYIYVFGSRSYTQFVEQTNYWKQMDNIKMFKSWGSAGPCWLSPIINDLASSILRNDIDGFNKKYPNKLIKQR